MKITALQEYGIRCLLQLAAAKDKGPQRTTAIAKKEGLSRDYVEKILFQLRKGKMVKSTRGVNGGYVLEKDPDKIFLGEVIQVLSEKKVRMNRIKTDLCKQFPGKKNECVHLSQCAIRMLWSMIMLQVYGVLNHLPLSFLLGTEQEVQGRLMEVAQKWTKNPTPVLKDKSATLSPPVVQQESEVGVI